MSNDTKLTVFALASLILLCQHNLWKSVSTTIGGEGVIGINHGRPSILRVDANLEQIEQVACARRAGSAFGA